MLIEGPVGLARSEKKKKTFNKLLKFCFSFPHILGVNPKFAPNSLNCLLYTAWLCGRKRNSEDESLKGRALTVSDEQVIGCAAIILQLHVLFFVHFFKPAIFLEKKYQKFFFPPSGAIHIHSVKKTFLSCWLSLACHLQTPNCSSVFLSIYKYKF